jgi:hypothetical protein
MKHLLPFNANGHLFNVPDGELVTVSPSVPGDPPYVSELLSASCYVCDEYPELDITGTAVTVRAPCLYRGGFTGLNTLAVPSGKVIVSDDLRPVYNWDDSKMASYNSALGQKQAADAMAKAGCAYGPVGNSCPGLYRISEDRYAIASLAYDEETDQAVLPAGWEPLASVITDLWAYSIADFEDWKSKGGDPAALGWGQSVVDIAPGTYQFIHHTWESGFNQDAAGTVIFAHVRLLEDYPFTSPRLAAVVTS